MSDEEIDFMCDDDEDYDLVSSYQVAFCLSCSSVAECWTPGSESQFETLRRSIYETPDWDGRLVEQPRPVEISLVVWDFPALMNTLNFRF